MKKKAAARAAKAASRQSTLNFPTSSEADLVAESAAAETATKSGAKNRRKRTADFADDTDISLIDATGLLDKLGSNWKKPSLQSRQAVRIPSGTDWVRALSSDSTLRWAVAGESSAYHYTMFSQGGPRLLAVSNAVLAETLLNAKRETVRSFADLELMETDAPDFYFGNETGEDGIHWASRLQTWLELQRGDARQQEAAQDLRGQILSGSTTFDSVFIQSVSTSSDRIYDQE